MNTAAKKETGKAKKENGSGRAKKKGKSREHSLASNYWFVYKGYFRHSRWNLLFVSMVLFGRVSSTYMRLYIPKMAVALVMAQVSAGTLVGTLLAAEGVYFLLNEIRAVGHRLSNNPGLKYRHVLEERILRKICRTAYSNLEDPDYKKKISQAQHLYYHWDRDVRMCIWCSLELAYLLITIPISVGILAGLHPTVILAMAAGTWLQYQVGKQRLAWEKKHRDFWTPLERKIAYISDKMGDFTHAKDLRLYGAGRWLLPKYEGLLRERRQWKKRQRNQAAAVGGLVQILEMAKQAFMYGFLIWGVMEGRVKPDDFIFYVGLASSLSDALTRISGELRNLREKELSIADYRSMMERPDSGRGKQGQDMADGGQNFVPGTGAPHIVFSHVSFAYPGKEKEGAESAYTLQDVNFTIRPGEKIALVGLNGAGKTTLIKLLCGMYEPTEGEILLNGQSSTDWSLEEWYRFFAVVFQDIGVIPATIAENVAACALEAADRARVRYCLEQAGLWERVESLSHGMDTYLRKEMFREGVNLSGGEIQKLLLARAIYREAPVLILDEPTAALDAIAENELYLKYNELTRGRTSLFISHRLSSTRFCDRIFLLEGGRIVEQGSHQELMEKKGVYYQLFQVQSHYYQKDRTEGFTSQMDPSWEVSGYVSS